MPTIITRGAASARGYGFAESAPAGGSAAYIEDYFTIDFWAGNSTTGGSQTITNGLNLASTGGMVWIRGRNTSCNSILTDTARGAGTTAANNQAISSNINAAEDMPTSVDFLSAFNSNGFTVTQGGGSLVARGTNYSTVNYVGWTFLKKAKFFDIVTYTGNGSNRTISHNLGAVPGMILVKRLNTASDWFVYHRSIANTEYLILNSTAAKATLATAWNSTTATSTQFSVGTSLQVNNDGSPYVAYLFAHDAGGFGESGNDNVISCGTFTCDSGGAATVSLGYEPQFLIAKRSNSTTSGEWRMVDAARGFIYGAAINTADDKNINASSTAASEGTVAVGRPTPDGFQFSGANNGVYVYMAIRRPQKAPTSGSQVLGISARSGTNANATVTGSAGMTDLAIIKNRGQAQYGMVAYRQAFLNYLIPSSNVAESTAGTSELQANPWDVMDGIKVGTTSTVTNASSNTFINYLFRRAPKFFEALNYTGTGSNLGVAHGLGVAPELWIVKNRTVSGSWMVGASVGLANTEYLVLESTAAKATAATAWNSTTPTSSTLTVGTHADTNTNTALYAAFLFATLSGVSKVGTYTGNASTNQINCGFAGGARFVLIKRIDDVGDWYFWDTARGIVAGNDPYMLLNSDAAEVTNTDYIDVYSAGFELSSTAPAAVNANNGTFLYLAIS